MTFNEWWKSEYSDYRWYGYSDDPISIEVYTVMSVAEDAWDSKKEDIAKTVKRLENYPTDMSCFNTREESEAATNLKNRFIAILKEELL